MKATAKIETTALEAAYEVRPAWPAARNDGVAADTLHDARFRRLLGARNWMALPAPVRRRFSKRLAPGETVLYRGRVTETTLTIAGRVVAQLARLIGSPLPLGHGETGAAAVAVTEDSAIGGQIWTRLYARACRFPQVVHSAKRFQGPTGLEEYVGRGVGMALELAVEEGALVFRSRHYFLQALGRRWRLPRLLAPGAMEIVHREEGGGTFSFILSLTHPLLGRLIHQVALFEEVVS